jgi:sulfatase maturation enzyme AslB (radical SAM superfamily)
LVSVDGTRQTHNKQRIWADSRDEDCWVRVMRNLYMLVNKVDRDKISVQACVDDED